MGKKNILVTWELTEAQRRLLESACPDGELRYVPSGEVTAETLRDTTAVLGNLPPARLKDAPQLEWVQLGSAGANGYCDPGALEERVVLTNASGAYGLAISEHMIGMLLMLQKKLDRYYDNQKRQLWQDEGSVTGIWNSRTLVLGMGNLGTEFAKRMAAMGSHAVGLRRSEKPKPDCFEEQYGMEQLDAELAKADVVALCLPGTGLTAQILDARRLSLMKPTAILLNSGRGVLVDNLALARALGEHRLAGAALDVTDPEPLPAGHPLWDAPNTLITPHVSGGYHMKETFELVLSIAAENLSRYSQGLPLKHQVDRSVGY